MSSKPYINHFLNINYPYANSWDSYQKNHAKFTVQNIHYSMANALRRTMIAKLPTIGFKSEPHLQSTVKVERNDTYLNNQIISHRLAMIPINIPHPDQFDTEDIVFILDQVNETNSIQTVTTEHFKAKRISTNVYLSDKELRTLLPADPLTGEFYPIVKLKPKYYTGINQASMAAEAIGASLHISGSDAIGLKLTAKVVRAAGDENAHFSPVAACAYGNTRDLEKAQLGLAEFIVSQNKQNIASGLTPYSDEVLTRRFNLNEIQRYYKVDEYGEPNSFDFTVESVGVIPPLVCLERATRWLVDSVEKLIVNLETGNDQAVVIRPVPALGNGFEIVIEGEDDTLGNMLQCSLIKQYADLALEKDQRKLASVSYYRTHPLERRIVITVKPIDSATMDACVSDVIIPGCRNLITELKVLVGEIISLPEYIDEIKRITS